jgi:hypothetical protein
MKCDNCQNPKIDLLIGTKISRTSKEKGTIDSYEYLCKSCFNDLWKEDKK